MRRLILAFGLILGCEDEAPPPPPPAPVVAQDTGADEPEEDEEAAAKPERTAAEAAHDLLVAGDAAGALAAAKALEDKALGARLVESAVLAGAPDDGAQPLLGLELKLAGGDAAGALSGALAAIGDGTGDAAVLVARSVLAGAVMPEETTLPDGAEALVNWATARDANRARRFAAKADLVKGWRADHFRLDRAMAWKDSKGALGAADALAANGDPRAKLAGLLAKLDQIDNGTRRGVANSERAQWASTAQTIALAEGSLDQINKATNFAVDALKKANDFAGALDAATQSQTLALAAEVDGTSASLAVADAAILVGDPAKAIDVAAAVRAANPDATSEAHQQAAWTEGLGAWTLGRAEALDAAAAAARGPSKDALKALSAMMKGDIETARLQFPPSGLSGQAAAQVYGAAAITDPKKAAAWHDLAIKGADASGISSLSLSTRLAKESLLRVDNRRAAATLRRAIANNLNLSPNVGGELAVRAVLGGSPDAGAGATGPSAGIWSALSQNVMPAKVEGETFAGLLHWARGRAAAATGRLEGHDGQFPAALGKLPLHRIGQLDLGTVVDGSQGVDTEKDVALLAKLGSEVAAGLALAAHDVGHRMDKSRLDLSLGSQQLYGVSDEAREALLKAVAKARADIRAWHAGKGEFPTASLEAVAAAEAEAAKTSEAFKTILPQKGTSAEALLSDMRRGAVISYRADHGRLQAVAVSREGSAIKDLGSSAEAFRLAAAYRAAMVASGPDPKVKTDHSAGHMLRTKIIDPFTAELTGVGRYVIVGPPSLLSFPLTTLPEQAEGLRWLADIRQMASAPTIAALHRSLRPVTPDTYKLDYLAFGGEKAAPSETELTNFEDPDELKLCGRYFQSGFNDTLIGKDATLESWREKSANSRYIHIAEMPPAMAGGFQMANGTLSLDEIRNTKIHAEMVVITARTTPEQQLHRVRAFLDAGARWVLVSTWDVHERTRVRFLGNIYDSMNQERPPVRALSEGRNRLFGDALSGIDLDDPALWGGLTLFGKP